MLSLRGWDDAPPRENCVEDESCYRKIAAFNREPGVLHPELMFAESSNVQQLISRSKMSKDKLKQISTKMKKIDFCMMTTRREDGGFNSRPMSTNGDVEYEGDSWFFTYDDSEKVKEIKSSPEVSLDFQGDGMVFIHVAGQGKIVKDKTMLEKHWKPELKMWFPEEIETPGIVLVRVDAQKIRYWNKAEEFEIEL